MSNFDGDGFSEKILQGEEAARHREMFSKVNDLWGTMENIDALAQGAKVLFAISKVSIPLGILGLFAGMAANYFGWV